MGKRPSIRDQKLLDKVYAAISVGVSVRGAAVYVGIDESTFYKWQTRGRRERAEGRNTAYVRFVEGIDRARARAEVALVGDLRRLAVRDSRALMSMLARLYPEDWAEPGKRIPKETEHRMHRAAAAKVEAEAKLADARADALKKAAEGGGAIMLVPQDMLAAMPEELRTAMTGFLAEQGVSVFTPPSFGANVTQKQIDAASPSGVTLDVQPASIEGPKQEGDTQNAEDH